MQRETEELERRWKEKAFPSFPSEYGKYTQILKTQGKETVGRERSDTEEQSKERDYGVNRKWRLWAGFGAVRGSLRGLVIGRGKNDLFILKWCPFSAGRRRMG